MIHDFIARWSAIDPGRVAIEEVATGSRLTYGQLSERAARLAVGLREGLELPAGARVAMLTTARAEVFEMLFAAARARATLIPLNTRLAAPELVAIVRDAAPDVIVYDDVFAETAAAVRAQSPIERGIALGQIRVDSGDVGYPSLVARSRAASSAGIELEDVPLVLYTSGTTGEPKGVMIPWRQVVFNAVNTQLACELTARDACCAMLPLYHTGGLHCLATPLLHAGGRVVLTAGFDPGEVIDLFASGRVTTTIAVPQMYRSLLDAGLAARSAPGMRALLCGGAPCPIPLIEEYHDADMPLRQGYGLTEVGPNCFSLAPLSGRHRLGSVGWPAFHGQARLVGDDGVEVGDGEAGELLLRGPHVTAGYLNKPGVTAEVLDDDGWFHTRDTLRRSDDGAYYVVGRKKNMFISGGENVYPTEVELALLGHPAIAEAAVIAMPSELWGQVGLAALVGRDGVAMPSSDALRDWLRTQLAGYKVPHQWRVVPALPLTASGKVERSALRRELAPASGRGREEDRR